MLEESDFGYIVDTAGLGGDEKMTFYKGPSSCGMITDGVGINASFGGWVISFEDFEKIYLLAKQERERL